METKHTPAPWYIQFMNETDPDSDFWVKSDYNKVVHYGTDIMQDDYGEHNGYPREQRLADARLIAAAPELFQKLYQVVIVAEQTNNEIPKSFIDMWITGARQAIQKATE